MRMNPVVLASCALLAACAARPADPTLTSYGTLREALRDGRTGGRVALSELDLGPDSFGVGALAGLAGEITLDGGTAWITEPDGRGGLVTTTQPGAREATVLFVARCASWSEHVVERDVSPAELDAYLGGLVEQAGFAPGARLPFVVDGPLAEVHAHVIAGECPIRARMLEQPVTHPPFELRAARLEGRLVGLWARQAGGELTHMGSDTHLHLLWRHAGATATAHVESVGLAAGSVLRLPAG